jgi:hypothetical protein
MTERDILRLIAGERSREPDAEQPRVADIAEVRQA